MPDTPEQDALSSVPNELSEQQHTEEQWKAYHQKVPLDLSATPTASFKKGTPVRASKTDPSTKKSTYTTCIVEDVKYDEGQREHTYQLKVKSTGQEYESGAYVAESKLR